MQYPSFILYKCCSRGVSQSREIGDAIYKGALQRMKRRILLGILAGGILLTLTACGHESVEAPQPILVQEDEEEAYPTATVDYGDVVKHITVRCDYSSTNKQELAFPIDGGLVERVEVKMGEYVEAGQLLVALDVQNLESTIEDLEYDVQNQALKLKQTKEMKEFELASADTMYSYTFMTEQDKENLKAEKEGIEARYKTTLEDMEDQLLIKQQRLQKYRDELATGLLYADITGEITYLENGLAGTYTKKDRVVVTVSDLDSFYFIANNNEYAECFKEGESVMIMYRDGATEIYCEAVPALMDSWEENMYFKPLGDEIIASRTNGTITVEYDRRENVLCVPEDAVHESDKGLFVYLVNEGLLEMRYVTVGLEGDELVEITDGLAQGDIIALKE